ncbi:unnamed protein product [Polarella glacialis]|uniref:Uncharacterized protein n=1 Tax=Polarella glacialis TaxID=89957 RepID=A0A813K309_POLGL|nr:unnamed protein product [Polarella glacialis]CAE8692528.1 unnamed protein product [Polarella glacialis]
MTEPSNLTAAKAPSLPTTCTTPSWSRCSTCELSPPKVETPHVMTETFDLIAANARILATHPYNSHVGKDLKQTGQATLGLNSSLPFSNLQRKPGFDLYAAWNNTCALQCPCQEPLVIFVPLIAARVMFSDLRSSLDDHQQLNGIS